jgi:hypothetical protein
MKKLRKRSLFPGRETCSLYKISLAFLFLFSSSKMTGQIANFVNNGGFEESFPVPPIYHIPTYWSAPDSGKAFGELLSKVLPPYKIPKNSYGYQWPRSGNNILGTLLYCPTCSGNNRGYPKNRLKKTLAAGINYCVSIYVNLTNESTHGISQIGCYFGDGSIDTITRCNSPITYLIPQITNPVNSVIIDTLNWILILGEFIANGTEKYLVIGNFASDSTTNKILNNPTHMPVEAANYLIDDVSVIATDLPAYAGPDHALIPGDSAFIGREPDVGIDEACMWYKLPNDSVPIDTVAGLWVKPVGTATYVVRQQLNCGGVKWDTVVVYENPLGVNSLFISAESLRVYPNPADEILKVELRLLPDANLEDQVFDIMIYNNLGQVVKAEKISFEENALSIQTDDLPEGVYTLQLKSAAGMINKRFLIAR